MKLYRREIARILSPKNQEYNFKVKGLGNKNRLIECAGSDG